MREIISDISLIFLFINIFGAVVSISLVAGQNSINVSNVTRETFNVIGDSQVFPQDRGIFETCDERKLEFISGEILVKFKSDVSIGCSGGMATTSVDSVNELNKRFRVVEMKKVLWNVYKLVFPSDVDVFSMAEEYEANLNVEYAEPNYIYHTCVVPNDADYALQWAHKVIKSEAAWNRLEQ